MELDELFASFKKIHGEIEDYIQKHLDDTKNKANKCSELLEQHNKNNTIDLVLLKKSIPPQLLNINFNQARLKFLLNIQADLCRQLTLMESTIEWYLESGYGDK